MKNVFFSILIPVYKNIDYLENCLESIIGQNYTDFEVIVCYQGDTEQETKVRDTRIRNIYLEKPSLYLARKESYQKSKGDYVLFVDSDDELLDGALSILQKTITQNENPDIIQFGYTSRKDVTSSILLSPPKSTMSQEEYLSYFLSELGTYPIWRKCFKRNDIQFYDEDIFMGEDALFTLAFINRAQKIVSVNETLYFYRLNAKSGTSNLKSKYLDDLAVFLIHSSPYRKNKREIEMEIYSFICTYFTFRRTFSARELLSFEHVRIIAHQIETYSFTTSPKFVKKTFDRNIQLKNCEIVDKFRLLMLKAMHLFKRDFTVELQMH